jgi:hypothetical protein
MAIVSRNVGKVVDRHGENRSRTTSRGVATLDSSRHVPKYKFDNFFFYKSIPHSPTGVRM